MAMYRTRIIAIIVAFTIFPNTSHSYTIKEYEKVKDNPPLVLKIYIAAFARGLMLRDAMAPTKNDKLICIPDNVKLSKDDYISILNSYLIHRANEGMGEYPKQLRYAIYNALHDRFPCGGQK